jgi:hypothetical protein
MKQKIYKRTRSGKLCEQVALYMESDKHTLLKDAAFAAGKSMSGLVDDILCDYAAVGHELMTKLGHLAERDGLERSAFIAKVLRQYADYRASKA